MSRLSDNYSFVCKAHGIIGIDPNASDEEVREYMFGKHNERTLAQFNGMPTKCLALAYGTSDKGHILTPQYREIIKTNFGIIIPNKLEEILVTHNGIFVDTMTKEELNRIIKKIHHENPSLRQPAA